MDGVALEVQGPGRWVEDHALDVGEGGAVALRRGLLFPVVDGAGGAAGVVFVGAVSATLPAAGAGLAVRAAVPGAQWSGAAWTSAGDLLLSLGRDPDLAAAATAGVPILPRERDVVFLDEQGREVVLITDLRPVAALDDARDALRQRSWLLAQAGLDPLAMLAREAWRAAEPRSITELRPAADLLPLAPAERGRPWLTWVVDPSGLVDDAYAGVLGVHGGPEAARTWRALGGAPHHGRAAFVAERAVANATVARSTGTTLQGDVTVALTLRAGEEGRLLDLWVPETLDLPHGGALATDSDPVVSATTRGEGVPTVEAPFGPRAVAGARRHSLLLPTSVRPGDEVSLRLSWSEDWDVAGVLLPKEFVPWAWDGPANKRPSVAGLPEVVSLGKVATGLAVFPTVATGPGPYPVELRAGTNATGWTLAAGAGATAIVQENGTLFTIPTHAPAAVAVGRFKEFRSQARAGMPPIRVLRHDVLDEDLLITIRGILHFYDTALPPFPFPEVVVVQGQHRPVLMVEDQVVPQADPHLVTPGFRHVGAGVLEFRGVFALGPPIDVLQGQAVRMTLPPAGDAVRRQVDRTRPNAPTRSLAEALAAAWWDAAVWSDRDRWLAGAIPALYRDRFVEEAWGHDALRAWDRATDEALARSEPAGAALPLGDAEWAHERGVRLLRLVMARIGEEETLRALERLRAGDDPSLAALVALLEDESGVSFAGLFDLFATTGLRPTVTASVTEDGALTVTTDPPVGTWDVPIAVGGRLRWVPVVDGVGTAALTGTSRELELDPERWLPLARAEEVEEAPVRRRGDRRGRW
jgi:hypothetical protein